MIQKYLQLHSAFGFTLRHPSHKHSRCAAIGLTDAMATRGMVLDSSALAFNVTDYRLYLGARIGRLRQCVERAGISGPYRFEHRAEVFDRGLDSVLRL